NVNTFKIIHQPVVQFFGKISYSLYLWHWPVIVLSQYFAFPSNLVTLSCLCIISIILSYLSFRYIETAKHSSKPILATMVVLFACNFALGRYSVNKMFFKAKTLEVANYSDTHREERNAQMSEGKCFTTSGVKAFKNVPCLDINDHQKNYLLIGDSHGAHISQSLREALAKKGINLLQATASGGMPTYKFNDTLFWIFKSKTRQQSRDVMNYVYRDFIPKNIGKLDGVIISGHWAQWPDFSREQILNYIQQTIAYLNGQHVKCIIIGQSEVYNLPYTTILAKDIQYNSHTTSRYLDKKAADMNKYLRDNLKPFYVDIYDYDSVPPMLNNEVPYMTDGNHFSKYGADLAVSKILSSPATQNFFGNATTAK
ncbi:MAG TPA: acyltransferase family protein, partial [Mucilaginibacter sp.]|nr:acyltransferase family protein [Mucilaginibacter sp.]